MKKILIQFFIIFMAINISANTNDLDSIIIYRLILDEANKYHNNNLIVNCTIFIPKIDDQLLVYMKKVIKNFDSNITEALSDLKKNNFFDFQYYVNIFKYKNDYTSEYQLSSIGYNKSHTIAIIYENDNLIPLAGHGVFYILEKNNKKWEIKYQIPV